MSEWSDDDEVLVAPPPSMKAPPRSTRVEEQSKGKEGVPKQQAMGVPEQRATGVPERQEEARPTIEAARPSHHKMQESTPSPRLGDLEGNASLEKYTGKPTRKYPCLGVILVSYPHLFW